MRWLCALLAPFASLSLAGPFPENCPGGNRNIGADAVAKSPPDGHGWLLAPGYA